ncbi:MAG: 50S ribosomal protein L17 [Deltaproteobacteria bacterium]
MRHRRKTQNLSRFSSYYKATVRSLARAVILHQRIVTTHVRAKMARQLVDRLITMGKQADSLSARRRAYAFLNDHRLVNRLFTQVAPMFAERTGGYTRIIPYKRRRGDNAELVVLELSSQTVSVRPAEEPVDKQEEKKRTAERVRQALQADKAPEGAAQDTPEKPAKPKGGIGKLFKKKSE